MSPFYLFITYKLGVRLTLLKANKAGQRMGPPDRAVGAKREARRSREGCGSAVKGAGGGRWGGASRQDPVSRDHNTFMASISSLLKLSQLSPASRKFQTLKDTRGLKRWLSG